MAMVRRHWKAVLLFLAAVLGGSIWLLIFNPHSRTLAQTTEQTTEPTASEPAATNEAPKLDPVTFCAVRSLREELRLRDEDLAALGCSEEAAKGLLQSLLGWYESNASALSQAENSIRAARRELRAAVRQMNMGPRDEALEARIPAIQQALGEAVKQRREFVEKAVTAALQGQLTSEQQAMWTTARTVGSGLGAYGYTPGLQPSQASTLRKALSLAAHRRMLATTPQQKEQAESELAAALSSGPQASVQTVRANLQQNLPGVLKASQEVLPTPEELRQAAPIWSEEELKKMQQELQESGNAPQ